MIAARLAVCIGVMALQASCDERRPHVGGRSAQEWIRAVRDSGVLRADAVAAIARLASESPEVASVLESALGHADPAVRLLVLDGIGAAASRAQLLVVQPLERVLLSDPVDSLRTRAAWVVGRISAGERDAVASLAVALRDPAPAVRIAAANALTAIGAPARPALAALAGLLQDSDTMVRRAGRDAVGALRGTRPQ